MSTCARESWRFRGLWPFTPSWPWDVYVIGVCAAGVSAVWLLNSRYPGDRVAATVALVAVPAWVVLAGRELMDTHEYTPKSVTFALGVIVFFTAALFSAPAALIALPMIYPLLFRSLPVRGAIAASTAANLIPTLGVLLTEGPHSEKLPLALAATLVAVAAAPVAGTMITVTADQRTELAALVKQLEASRAETARLAHEAGIAGERERLARDIHDTLAQGFTSIITLARATESDQVPPRARRHLDLIVTTAQDNLAEARALVAELTPAPLAGSSLADAIERQGRRLADETGIAIDFAPTTSLPPISTAGEVVLLRTTQEALANVRKHAQASAVRILLCRSPNGVFLTIADDGVGFDINDDTTGFGLRGMRSRAEHIGGSMSITSSPHNGTSIHVEVPT